MPLFAGGYFYQISCLPDIVWLIGYPDQENGCLKPTVWKSYPVLYRLYLPRLVLALTIASRKIAFQIYSEWDDQNLSQPSCANNCLLWYMHAVCLSQQGTHTCGRSFVTYVQIIISCYRYMQQTSHKAHAHVVGGLLHAYVTEDLVSNSITSFGWGNSSERIEVKLSYLLSRQACVKRLRVF